MTRLRTPPKKTSSASNPPCGLLPPPQSGLAAEVVVAALASASESAKANFTDAMDDDFNTAGAIAALYELVKAINTARDNGANDEQLKSAQDTFRELTGVLGLRLQEKQGSSEQKRRSMP